jgi:hypothetical protein
MNFTQRLAYYLLGLLIGGVFLKFVLDYTGSKGLDFTYMPNARVLKNIRNKSFNYTDIATAKMLQKHIDATDIKAVLTNGDVDFSLSNKPMEGGKVYIIEGQTAKNITTTLQIINYENKAVLKDILK